MHQPNRKDDIKKQNKNTVTNGNTYNQLKITHIQTKCLMSKIGHVIIINCI